VKELSDVRRRPRVQTVNTLPSVTVQSDLVRSDIRHILAKYKQTGVVEHMRNVDLEFRDVSEFPDFADLMLQSKEAEKVFLRLPSKVREVFDHDVAVWLDCAHDADKLKALQPELEALGLVFDTEAKPSVPPVAVAAPVVP